MQAAFEQLVVPVAGTDTDARVLDLLRDLLRKEGGTVTFLYVVEVPQSMPLDAELPREVDRGEAALRNAEQMANRLLPQRSTQVLTELLQARTIGPAIVDEAIERDADAVIMTAAIQRKHGRPTLGETAMHVLLHAPCEVVVIRTANEPHEPMRPVQP